MLPCAHLFIRSNLLFLERSMKRITTNLFVLFCYMIIIVGTGRADESVTLFVGMVPQQNIVQQTGKGFVHTKVMVQPGAGPATYEPKPRQMAALTRSQNWMGNLRNAAKKNQWRFKKEGNHAGTDS
jgi:ABC-type Zn uptake system ZnuABC Zn-binding protein ZnuA